jgi:hypothetical protein
LFHILCDVLNTPCHLNVLFHVGAEYCCSQLNIV